MNSRATCAGFRIERVIRFYGFPDLIDEAVIEIRADLAVSLKLERFSVSRQELDNLGFRDTDFQVTAIDSVRIGRNSQLDDYLIEFAAILVADMTGLVHGEFVFRRSESDCFVAVDLFNFRRFVEDFAENCRPVADQFFDFGRLDVDIVKDGRPFNFHVQGNFRIFYRYPVNVHVVDVEVFNLGAFDPEESARSVMDGYFINFRIENIDGAGYMVAVEPTETFAFVKRYVSGVVDVDSYRRFSF